MKRIKLIGLICGLTTFASFGQHNTFYIGHSGFGWDLIVGEMVNDLAEDAGITTYDYNYQFKGGTCLSNAWETSDSPDGGVDAKTELPNGYDVVVLAEQIPIAEVIYTSPWGPCNLTSVEAVDSFYDLTLDGNPNARIFLMEFLNEVDFTGPTPHADWVALNADMRPLWEQVADSVTLINPGGPQVCIVPIAAAWEALVDSVMAGSFPGITDWTTLFDPADPAVATIHPTEVTYYLVACVHYAVIFGESPVGLTNETFAVLGWAFDPPTPEQAEMMQEIAWEIASNDEYACISEPASIVEPEPISEMSIYPNPSDGLVQIEFEGEADELQIHDFSGRLIQTYSVNKQKLQLELESGIYLATLISNGHKLSSQKIIVK